MEYQIMFYGGLAGAVVTLIISIIVYMKLQISQVFADITGNRFMRKKQNSRISLEAHETKRTTSEIKLRKKDDPVAASVEDTALMSQGLEPTSLLEESSQAPTELLVEETSLLSEETALLQDDDETTLLVGDDETTILLEGDGETAILTEKEEESDFQIEVDVMIVHTNNVINFTQQKSPASSIRG
ncbi:hypothetical protein [Ferdinandcohnia sp. SAFN-114]|uniref:hypothetical protein n=1 Tax=Ferdinandcohnia sp. SAFN-114 TaxID=3387275 RepID=UPI003F7F2C44